MFGIGVSLFLVSVHKRYISARSWHQYGILIAFLVGMYFWSPGAFFAFQGQMKTTVYPADMLRLQQELSHEPKAGKILILPWHNYYGCKWTGRPVIADPAIRLIAPHPAISSNAIEVGNILHANEETEETRAVRTFLETRDARHIQEVNISHILAMRNCGDIAQY